MYNLKIYIFLIYLRLNIIILKGNLSSYILYIYKTVNFYKFYLKI